MVGEAEVRVRAHTREGDFWGASHRVVRGAQESFATLRGIGGAWIASMRGRGAAAAGVLNGEEVAYYHTIVLPKAVPRLAILITGYAHEDKREASADHNASLYGEAVAYYSNDIVESEE